MAVYTHLGAEDMAALLAPYHLGDLVSAKGIAEGVSNSNWLIETAGDHPGETVASSSRCTNSASRSRTCPISSACSTIWPRAAARCRARSTTARARSIARSIPRAGKALALIEFLPGVSLGEPTAAQARAVGAALAGLHGAAADYAPTRANAMGLAEWQRLAQACGEEGLTSIDPALGTLVAQHLPRLAREWPKACRPG
jgi:homoserine kinase type II